MGSSNNLQIFFLITWILRFPYLWSCQWLPRLHKVGASVFFANTYKRTKPGGFGILFLTLFSTKTITGNQRLYSNFHIYIFLMEMKPVGIP